ncbi:MAG: SDR family oxidoreductase [Candidatus Heimdallarchaeota archaeon]|nr:MAG: SDR family oxidoreductase [Candidatus Heimdallarchaeota archaeon]
MESGLNGEHVLITGASGGIGQATAKLFDKEGCSLSLHYNKNQEQISQFSKELNGDYCLLQADLSSEEQTKELIQDSTNTFGRIDHLVVNHGIWPEQYIPAHEMTLDQWDQTLTINLRAAFICSRQFLLNLLAFPKETASIVYIGSTAGIFGEAGHVDYSVSKSGLQGLMLSLKNEIIRIASRGRVNIVAPGWTITPMAEKSLEDHEAVRKALQTMPLRKIARPIDIARTVVFLSSDKLAGHISGQIITVAGGMEGRKLFEPDEIDINSIL